MDPMSRNGHRRAELRSLALHREIAARIAADPTLLGPARRRVAGWLAAGGPSREYAAAWQALLDGSGEVLLAALRADDERSRDLRQATPFAYVVPPRERWRIWRAVPDDEEPAP